MKRETRKKALSIISGTLAIILSLSLFGTLIYYNSVNKRIYNNYSNLDGQELTEEELFEMFKQNAAKDAENSGDVSGENTDSDESADSDEPTSASGTAADAE